MWGRNPRIGNPILEGVGFEPNFHGLVLLLSFLFLFVLSMYV